MRISRKEFQAAIERGIAGAPDLNIEERNALRLVGLSANEALVGLFQTRDCGCPLTQAGLFTPGRGRPWSNADGKRRRPFYRGFDDSFPLANRVEVID